MSFGWVSFRGQAAHFRAANASATARYFSAQAGSAQTSKAVAAGSAAANSFASAATNFYESANVLAARAGVAVQNNAASAKSAGLSSSSDISDEVSFQGSLAGQVDFGTAGPSAAGAYQFVQGADLKSAFRAVMVGQLSNKELADTVSVSGQTLTASTSGDDAHDVFTLTLRPQSGQFTFTLLNPIDLSTKDFDPSVTLNLTALFQGVKSTGETVDLPNTVKITIDGNKSSSRGTAIAGTIHEGNLAYTSPAASAPAPSAPYESPYNYLTGHSYVATTSSFQSTGVTLNLFA